MAKTKSADDESAKAGGAARRMRRLLVRGFAVLGVVLVGLLLAGTGADILDFDNTSGGYEPPYTGWTGEPIDWDEGYVTNEGFFDNNYVIDSRLDCTTGMISFEVFNLRLDYRELSDRALVVHKPAEACEAAGFDPEF
jgi:hypothetical protein